MHNSNAGALDTLLAGDIGATKAHLALYQYVGGKRRLVRNARLEVGKFAALEEVIRQFLGSDSVSMACLGVPGPVIDGRAQMANLPWQIDSQKLSANLNIPQVWLINDLDATSRAIAELSADQVLMLNKGNLHKGGARALIAAGTGLGESFLTWDGETYASHPSEGGHADFAPRNEDEIDLLRYLMRKYRGRVSIERVVSGLGMLNIYEFLRDAHGMEEPAWLAEELSAADDVNVIISANALAAKNALCEKTLDMFVSAYGAEAGNFGLSTFSSGGLYIGGGIAPRIVDKLTDGTFLRALTDKGRLSRILLEMPVLVILSDNAGLAGAAVYAETRMLENTDAARA